MEPVRDLDHLMQLASSKKSVAFVGVPGGFNQNRQPASWIIHWQCRLVHQLLPYMFVYEKQKTDHAKTAQKSGE